jgi:hypothetical protein
MLLWVLEAENNHPQGAYPAIIRDIMGIYNSEEEAYAAVKRLPSYYRAASVYHFDQEEDNL